MHNYYYFGKPFFLRLILLFFVTAFSISAYAQHRFTISGTVTDSSNNKPISGVSVIDSSSSKIAYSDGDGHYTLEASGETILVFRYLGYREKHVHVREGGEVNISLASSKQNLDEVVVVGFATQKKETVTGAISSIQTKEIKQSPAANLSVALSGRLPGLTVTQTSGEPGRDVTNLNIRGLGTTNGQAPLILVDGIERSFTYLDPNEVQSITILKDASATAVFGIRGANGVILVTTKRGTSEKPEINFTSEASIQGFTRKYQPVNSYDYATLRNQALINDGLAPQFSQEQLDHYKNGDDPLRYPNTNWDDVLMNKYSWQHHYNLNISGATRNKFMDYFVNASYLNQGGMFKIEKGLPYDPSFKLNRYSFRANLDFQLNKRLKAYLNIAGYLEKQNMPMGLLNRLTSDIATFLDGQSPAFYILVYKPFLRSNIPGPLTPDGEVTTGTGIDWPAYGLINRSGYIQQTRNNVTATYGMEQSLDFITKGLSAKVVMSFDASSTNDLIAGKEFARYLQVIDPNLQGADGQDSIYYKLYSSWQNTPLSISGGNTFASLSNFQAFLNYDRNFGKHAITGLALFQRQQNVIGSQLPYNLIGFSGRLTYNYASKYFVEFDAGYNGSEQFAKGKRFGFFPAISGAWLVSGEHFLRDNPTLTYLKIRGSYGTVGNDQLGGRRFLYLDDISVAPGGFTPSLGRSQYININSFGNPDISWEVAKKSDIGLEVGMLNAFNLVVDLFKEKRNNILINRGTIPLLNGFPSNTLPPVNLGVIVNKGYEIELSYQKAVSRDLYLIAKANLNYAKNKVLFADEAELPEDYAYRYRQTGFSIGQNFGPVVTGYFRDSTEIAKSPIQNLPGHQTRPGDFKYKDVNGDGVIDTRDYAPIGYPSVPEYTFGASFNISYKNFDLSALFQGVGEVSRYYGDVVEFATYNYVARNKESWTPERAANGEPVKYPRLSTVPNPDEILNSFFLENGNYVRLKNMEIGYTLPQSLTGKVNIKKIRIYINGSNLYTWDKLPTNDFDPEITSGYSYPITKMYNFGVNIIF